MQSLQLGICLSYTALKRLESLVKKTISMQNVFPNRLDRCYIQYVEVYKYFILCKMFKVICNGKQLHFFNEKNEYSIAHKYETRSNVGNCFTTLSYLKVNLKTRLFTVASIYGLMFQII